MNLYTYTYSIFYLVERVFHDELRDAFNLHDFKVELSSADFPLLILPKEIHLKILLPTIHPILLYFFSTFSLDLDFLQNIWAKVLQQPFVQIQNTKNLICFFPSKRLTFTSSLPRKAWRAFLFLVILLQTFQTFYPLVFFFLTVGF